MGGDGSTLSDSPRTTIHRARSSADPRAVLRHEPTTRARQSQAIEHGENAAVTQCRTVLIRSRRNLRRAALAAVLVTVVLVGSGFLGWTWRHPQAFVDAGGWGTGLGEKQVGDTIYVGMSYPRNRDGGHVTLHGGRVNVSSGSDNADVDLLVCTLDPDARVGAIGSYVGDNIHDDCSALEPIEGQRLDLQYAPMRQQVVLAVTLTHRGTVKVSDVTLVYSDRWQRGTQRTGGEVVVSTTRVRMG